ncbi:unnamed protein product [Lymnaea stagnalis]|uniref:Cation/H+ exchanger transmembrane domain-containing protein n=1 Tax=Lymnaea stagnalis TaxID=6523 RepID=A0AAV2GY48_LYMST
MKSDQENSTVVANGAGFPQIEFELVQDQEAEETDGIKKCAGLQSCFEKCTHPCLASSHPLPHNANCPSRFLDNFLCPPHSRMGAIIFMILITASIWATLVSVTGDTALPGGNLFALLVLFVACWCGGYLVRLIRLPPLLGMLVVGGMLGNVPYIDVAKNMDRAYIFSLRQIALTIILTRAGLGLDPKALRRLSFVVVRLAFLPCLTETIVDGIAGHLILGIPWQWGFMLGFVISAVSPAVIVPSLLGLGERGYGLEKGIPTLVIAAASIDDVLAITGFGVLLGITFSIGDIVWTLFKGPLEVIVGTTYGIVGGIILWYIPQKTSKHLHLFRSALLMALGLMAIFGSIKMHWAGAGPLAALTVPFVAAIRWRTEFKGQQDPIEDVVGVLWMLFQPFLFGLIGSEVKVSSLDGQVVGNWLGIAVLTIGLIARVLVSFLAVFFTNLNFKERFFIAMAWLPKATVQAAIGTVALDLAMKNNDKDSEELGKKVLTLAVLSILLTAPLGSLLISISGPLLLERQDSPTVEEEISKTSLGKQEVKDWEMLNTSNEDERELREEEKELRAEEGDTGV